MERQLPTDGELKTRGEADLVAMFVDAFAGRVVDAADLSLSRRLFTHPDAETIVASLLRDHLGAKALVEGDVVAEAAAARRGRNPPPVPAPKPAPVERPAPPPRAVVARPAPERAAAERPARIERTERSDRVEPSERVERPEPVLPRFEVGPIMTSSRTPRLDDRRSSGRDRDRGRGPARAHEARTPNADPTRTQVRAGVPHKNYATWEPPVDVDDDKPILTDAGSASAPPPPTRGADGNGRSGEREGSRFTPDDPDFAQIFINVGRRDGARTQDFERVLAEGLGLAPEDTGAIRVRDRNTFVSVRKASFDRVLVALGGQTIAGRSVIAEPAKQTKPGAP